MIYLIRSVIACWSKVFEMGISNFELLIIVYIPCTDYSSERVPVPKAESSFPVVFTNIQWGDYQLTIGCGNNSVCSALSQWIDFPEPVSVAAHPSLPEIGATIFDLKKTVADYNTIKDDDKNLQEKVASLSSHSDYLTDMVSVLIVEIAELKALHNGECARDWVTLLFLIIAVTDDPSPTTTLTPVIITETAEATISKCECMCLIDLCVLFLLQVPLKLRLPLSLLLLRRQQPLYLMITVPPLVSVVLVMPVVPVMPPLRQHAIWSLQLVV